ncbi:EamA family transporter [Streptomyces sp. NPDC005065]|uniref:EamA family transporter n=1 Tax=unclassified Streptomyces TaxID=2593676 RepID=UPI0033BE2CAE
MITAGLSAIAALGWGAADYFGARASRSVPAGLVVLLSQTLGLPVLMIWLLATRSARPELSSLLWGVCAGAVGLLGMVLLYRTLAAEGVTLVAPVTAVTAAVVPLAVGLFTQASPGLLALCGVFCAIASIALVNRAARAERGAVAVRTLLLALAAGGALGLQLVFLSHPGPSAGLWPMVGARACSILGAIPLVLLVLRHRGQSATTRVPWLVVGLAGALDTAGFAFYLFAMEHGLLGVVGPIVSLYPGATIMLAIALDSERVTRSQLVGLGLGAGALLLVAF